MSDQKPYRTKDEWFALIQEARKSGMTDAQWCLTNGISRNSITNPVPNAAPKLMLIHTSGCLRSGYFVIFTLYLDQRISPPRLFRFIQCLIRRHNQIVD